MGKIPQDPSTADQKQESSSWHDPITAFFSSGLRSFCQRFIPKTTSLDELSPLEQGQTIRNRYYFYFENGRYPQALEYAVRMLEFGTRYYGEKSDTVSEARYLLGVCYSLMQDPARAEKYLVESLSSPSNQREFRTDSLDLLCKIQKERGRLNACSITSGELLSCWAERILFEDEPELDELFSLGSSLYQDSEGFPIEARLVDGVEQLLRSLEISFGVGSKEHRRLFTDLEWAKLYDNFAPQDNESRVLTSDGKRFFEEQIAKADQPSTATWKIELCSRYAYYLLSSAQELFTAEHFVNRAIDDLASIALATKDENITKFEKENMISACNGVNRAIYRFRVGSRANRQHLWIRFSEVLLDRATQFEHYLGADYIKSHERLAEAFELSTQPFVEKPLAQIKQLRPRDS